MTSERQPHFVTCRCQHCDRGIEFDASDFAEGETYIVECPHCHTETELRVPTQPESEIPPVSAPPLPLEPIASSGQTPMLEVRLASGSSFDVLAVRLYEESCIEELKTKSAEAVQRLEEAAHAESLEAKKELRKLSARGAVVQQNIRPWDVAPTGAAAILGILEPFSAKKSYTTGMQLLKEVKESERTLTNRSFLFHISRIENLHQAVPDYWRAVFNSKIYIHNGLDFVTIRDVNQDDFSLRWSAVEYFDYSLKNDVPPPA